MSQQLKYGSIEGAGLEAQISSKLANEPGPVESFSKKRSEVIYLTLRLAGLVLVVVFAAFLVISSGELDSNTGAPAANINSVNEASSTGAMGASSPRGSKITYSTLSDDEQTSLFTDFMYTYSKTYTTDSEEYVTRLSNFKMMLQIIDDRNAAEDAALGDGVHGITKFADLTQAEYEEAYLMSYYEEDEYAGTDADRRLQGHRGGGGSKRGADTVSAVATRAEQVALLAAYTAKSRQLRRRLQDSVEEESASASEVDWSTSLTSPVNDQGTGCRAASWAFAAAQQIESDAVRKGYITLDQTLSVQQLLDCNTGSAGCTSGSLESAYDYSSKVPTPNPNPTISNIKPYDYSSLGARISSMHTFASILRRALPL